MKHWKYQFNIIAQSVASDKWEIQALYEDKLLECLLKFKGGNFVNLLSMSLKNARADLYEKNKKRYSQEVYIDENESERESGVDFDTYIMSNVSLQADDYKPVETQIFEPKTFVDDKLQLITYLVNKTNDKTTKQIVELWVSKNKGTYTEIANELNIDRTTVMRKLKRLEKHYDSKVFGDKKRYLK
jgi:transcriptional regulator with GAF, ATPase, and Fis domain